ncbi:ParB-like partition protein [Desulfitobacterium dehalogenans ATCC 51507]|uniref:ParB-like partition protein n=1 Tax=Desulfitobacterium dehalogenans (strain ATCC 51507 / DSM 9161 / JW/IU-DC1) TaxID=756499 RepID=I4ABZ9_DESDJ|nr:ParB/RepB/Spo0J family partition protein [Desulfitobacterium dehalogenans]AFM01484.1 ParB-like partition protein [Desulfitobacterium dehalogenans ATCC 51507]
MIEKKLRSLEDLFGDPIKNKSTVKESGSIIELELDCLISFSDHPFKLYTGERLENMVESIKENGVLQPIIVRPVGSGKYEILAGHNRVNASQLAGLSKIRAEIRDVDDHEAVIIVIATNLEQRSPSDMLPSELAKALKMQLEAAKATGKKQIINALDSPSNPHGDRDSQEGNPVGHRGKSIEKVADKNRMSKTNIQRYIRLNELIPDLLERVDDETIALRPAVHLSYLSRNEQQIIEDTISIKGYKIDMAKSEKLKDLSKRGKLTDEKIYSVLSGEDEKKPKKPTSIKLKPKLVTKFFKSEQNQAEIEKVIEEALTIYFQMKEEKEDE